MIVACFSYEYIGFILAEVWYLHIVYIWTPFKYIFSAF